MRIEACFDSHVHWAATGEFAQRLNLDHLTSAEDIKSLRPEKHHFRGEWLTGFGWDDNKWALKPNRKILDDWFPSTPVCLTRIDGHTLWVNTAALRLAGLDKNPPEVFGGRIEVDADGIPTGILLDHAMELIEKLIPPLNGFEIRRHLLFGTRYFNTAGFTHIRDMTCDEPSWNEAVRMDQSGLLTLAVEEYFWLKGPHEIDSVLALLKRASREKSPNLRVMGVKIFLDGALGSEGAWISRCYCGRNHAGLQLWKEEPLKETLKKVWEAGFEVAAHAIGDEAADLIVRLTRELFNEGVRGALHIEHGELMRAETIVKMKDLPVKVHIQPSHWLSDQKWLKEKIGDLIEHAFPWRRLQEANVEFDFGSDAPIEPASLSRTFQAIRQSAERGIPRLLGHPEKYMSHSDLAWAPNSFTLLDEETPSQVVFRGEHLL
jgi:predicted amidohydrolase YtcJ